MKAMVIGISPNYNYPGDLSQWKQDNTYYASNHGASFIIRSLLKQFDADYIDDFSDINSLRNTYNVCIMGLTTHAHARRDITKYVDIVEKLNIKTIVISIGVEDYLGNLSRSYKLHPSVVRLLNIVSERSRWIGVRGFYTASVIQQNGFPNVLPIGCPSIFSNLNTCFQINTKEKYNHPLIVYQRVLSKENIHLMKQIPLLGQDYQDEAFFTKAFNDTRLSFNVRKYYENLQNYSSIRNIINDNGIFTRNHEEWYSIIGCHDFVFGPRLHGCICALVQGIPAILTPRDLRTREIAEFFDLPHISVENLKTKTLENIYNKADFSNFLDTYKQRYNNYLTFLRENEMESKLEEVENHNYKYSIKDLQSIQYVHNIQINAIKEKNRDNDKKINNLMGKLHLKYLFRFLKKLYLKTKVV